MTRVCLAILAHNEAKRISPLLSDLRRQTLLSRADVSSQIHIVANGCTDETVAVASHDLLEHGYAKLPIITAVHDLPAPGKSNAWNEFIHELAPKETDFVFFLDADIRLFESDTLELMLQGLMGNPRAAVAVGASVKDLELRAPRSPIEYLIRAGTGTANNTKEAIAGGLYCARYSELAEIWMPLGLPGEDGFLRAMLLTRSFSQPEEIDRLVFIQGARHVFGSETTIGGVLHHNIRLAIGTAINILLFQHIRALRAQGIDPARYIKEQNRHDPKWLNRLIEEKRKEGFFILDPPFVSRRFRYLRSFPMKELVRRSPAFVLGTTFDLLVLWRANSLMRRGAGAGFW